MGSIESEFKIMLTLPEYEKLLLLYEFRTKVQTNHYYDTEDLRVSANHVTVRVRELDGKSLLQVKLPTEVSFSRIELERELDSVPEQITDMELESLCGRKLPTVRRLGKLTTTRNIHRFDGGEIDLDRSEYFDTVDYELEIEFTDEAAARRMLAKISEKLGIKRSAEICSGKLHRFIDRYREQMG